MSDLDSDVTANPRPLGTVLQQLRELDERMRSTAMRMEEFLTRIHRLRNSISNRHLPSKVHP
jgi:hypothetical protein